MTESAKRGRALLDEIDAAPALQPTLWWLGHCGFAIKYRNIVIYVDPLLSPAPGRGLEPPLEPSAIEHADLVLATHNHASHLDPGTVPAILASSKRAKLVLPKSAARPASESVGVSLHRMTTTDAGLRVEYFRMGEYLRIYAVPSAHPNLDHTPLGGYPYLGYLIRCGGCTLYHAGDCVPYDSLVQYLKPYSVNVALLPIDGEKDPRRNFSVHEAAQLAEEIGAAWVVPMHYGTMPGSPPDASRFIDHMLFHRPSQRFKVFACGEGWVVPED